MKIIKSLLLVSAVTVIRLCSYAQTTNTFPATGNVGIGTTNPGTSLEVNGVIRSTTGGFQIGKFGTPSNPLLSIGLDRLDFAHSAIVNGWGNSSNPGISVGTTRNDGTAFSVVTGVALDANFLPSAPGTTAFTVLGIGNVGVGTTHPNAPLEVVQPSDASVPLRLFGGTTSTALNKTNMLAFMISDTQGGEKAAAGIEGISNNRDVTGGYLSFLTSNGNIYDPNGLTERMRIDAAGNVGIGTSSPGSFRLAVNGGIHSQSVNVDLTGWSDYVFKQGYNLPSLAEVKSYIDQNHHLPDMPSEQEVIKDGINLGEMNRLLTKKVEELTLYLIEKDKENKALKSDATEQRKLIDKLELRLEKLELAAKQQDQ